MKVAILNDTYKGHRTTGGAHFGCQLVMEAIDEQCERVGLEVVQRVGSDTHKFKIKPEVDLVIVNGEGSIHHGARRELIDVAKEVPSVLINAVWQENDPYGVEHFKYIAVREARSREALYLSAGVEANIVPDMLFASHRLLHSDLGFRSMATGICSTDSVLAQNEPGTLSAINSAQYVINELQKYRGVVCGRFHAVAACAVLGIPFSAYSSNTHKIEGMMEDMGAGHLCFKTKEEALANAPDSFDSNIVFYSSLARDSIHKMFNTIAELKV